jgi:hypothetical protein
MATTTKFVSGGVQLVSALWSQNARDVLDAVLTFFAPPAAAPQRATARGGPVEPFSSGARDAECAGAGCAALAAGSLLPHR